MRNKKATDDQIRAAYEYHKSVWKAATSLGMNGSSVHERLLKMGLCNVINTITDKEMERLSREYTHYRDAGMLSILAADMGRTVPFLARKAGEIGLTDPMRRKKWLGKWKYMPAEVAKKLFAEFCETPMGATAYCKRKGMNLEQFGNTMKRFFPKEWDTAMESKVQHGKARNYKNGRSFEYQARDALADLGYYVIRAPQSKGIADLVAVRKDGALFVQCKKNGTMAPGEWNELFDASEQYGAKPILANSGDVGVALWVLVGRKDGSKRRQPMERFTP